MATKMNPNRREFLKTSTAAAFGTNVASSGNTRSPIIGTGQESGAGPDRASSMEVTGSRIVINTRTMTCVVDQGRILSIRDRSSNQEFLNGKAGSDSRVLDLVYPGGESVPVGPGLYGSTEVRQVSPLRAEVIFQSWKGEGVLIFTIDQENGDLLIEPSAFSSRPGVRACRWLLSGLREDLRLVAPFFQGIRLPLNDSLIKDSHWAWPMHWEAGLCILEGDSGGLWIHARDTDYRYKALKVGTGEGTGDSPFQLGFDTESYGPIDNNLSAGGLCWRLNVFPDNWTTPATTYRNWLWQAYNLSEQEAQRPSWVSDIRLAVSWCPSEMEILDALANRIDPKQVLLHIPFWRTDPYDENYPDYKPSETGSKFIRRAAEMGFHPMPHFNAVDMDPSHPVYDRIRDFQYRTLEKKELWGWSWVDGRPIGVPESNAVRPSHRDKKVMVKIHPGLSLWRSILGKNIDGAVRQLDLDTVFIDVTLTTGNLYNCLVEGLTSSEGMNRLIRQVQSLGNQLVVGGEGLNEITFQGLSFAQAHLFRSWHDSVEGLERTGGCALNDLLFGRLCRTIGYSGLGGKNDKEILRSHIHNEHNAIPTITIQSAKEITQPNSWMKNLLENI